MRRPTYDIEYLIDYASDYGTHASMSSAIDHVIDYIDYLETMFDKLQDVKLVQVFEWLKMPYELRSKFVEYSECVNDSYVAWYPNLSHTKEYDLFVERINSFLKAEGMINEDEEDEYFYVIFHVSW